MIEIQQPELETLIEQRMASGAFRDVDELLAHALGAPEERTAPVAPDLKTKSFLELCEPIRGLLTDEEADTLFRRDQSVSRPRDL